MPLSAKDWKNALSHRKEIQEGWRIDRDRRNDEPRQRVRLRPEKDPRTGEVIYRLGEVVE